MADDGSQQRKPDFRAAVADAKALPTLLAMEAEPVLGRRTARIVGVLALFAVVVGVLLALLDWYIAPTDAKQKQALVVTIAQILGGTALLLGLYFTWRTLQVNREGQITERFTRAIDQLGATDDAGDKLLEIRIGGIYALERIAKESQEDYWPIMQVFTAYVRHSARWIEEAQMSLESLAEAALDPRYAVVYSPPEPDIQAIMNVIRRRTHYWRHGEHERLDLARTNLVGANFFQANLTGAIFTHANLSEAFFIRANLAGAYLWVADLSGANLAEADLSEAYLSGAGLSQPEHLTQKQLDSTRAGDDKTQLPHNLKPPAHWGED